MPYSMQYQRFMLLMEKHTNDYDDFYIVTREKSQEQIETAEELIKMVEEYCKNNMGVKE